MEKTEENPRDVPESQGEAKPMDFSSLPEFPHTANFWKKYGQLPQVLEYFHRGEHIKIPAFYFLELPPERQLEIAHSLALATVNDRRELVYEIGFGQSLSPVDTAFAGKDRTVIAVDPKGEFYGRVRAGLESLKLPAPESYSLAALFKLYAGELTGSRKFPRSSWVQSFSPYPNMVKEIAATGSKLSDNVYVVLNPMAIEANSLDKMTKNLPQGFACKIKHLTKTQIEELLGTTMSAFLGGTPTEGKVPVLEAHRK